MKKKERERIVGEIFRRLDYCEEQSREAANAMCGPKHNYAEASVCFDKQADELKKVAHDCRLLLNKV